MNPSKFLTNRKFKNGRLNPFYVEPHKIHDVQFIKEIPFKKWEDLYTLDFTNYFEKFLVCIYALGFSVGYKISEHETIFRTFGVNRIDDWFWNESFIYLYIEDKIMFTHLLKSTMYRRKIIKPLKNIILIKPNYILTDAISFKVKIKTGMNETIPKLLSNNVILQIKLYGYGSN